MQVELLRVTDARWGSLLSRCTYDVYQTPAWTRVSEISDGGQGMCLIVRDHEAVLLAPLLRRPLHQGKWDAVSPYGYSGPIVSHGAPAGFAVTALHAGISTLRRLGCVSWFVRLHPLLPNHWTAVAPGDLVDHGPTVSIPLGRNPNEFWAETRSGHRSDILHARRVGVVVRRDVTFNHLESFITVYRETMRRTGARKYYMFEDDYFWTLRETLEGDVSLWVAELEGQFLAGSLFTHVEASGIVQYHLSGTAERGLKLQPSKLIIDAVRTWANDSGYRVLHLGGGLGGSQDGLYRFKSGFGRQRHIFRSLRIITNPAIYGDLCTAAGVNDNVNYFPAYRFAVSLG